METYHIVLFIMSLVIFVTYFTWIWASYGIQSSISESFYTIEKHNPSHPNRKWFFTLALWGFSFPLAIIGAEIHTMFFFAAAFIIFVGAAPAFKRRGMQHLVHMVGAIGGITLGLLAFFILGSNTAFLAMLFILIVGLLYFFNADNITWWTETTAFLIVWLGLFGLKFLA